MLASFLGVLPILTPAFILSFVRYSKTESATCKWPQWSSILMFLKEDTADSKLYKDELFLILISQYFNMYYNILDGARKA
jgi:hypothetical protein